jgi:RNA polymerase sigma-70 factor (ECF subfamily)
MSLGFLPRLERRLSASAAPATRRRSGRFDATAAEVLRVAHHLARDPATAEDLLQRTFLTAIEAASSWDRRRRLVPWLLGILGNHAKEAARRASRAVDPARLAPTEVPSPEAAAATREALAHVDRALDALPDPARSVLILRYRHGLEPAAIAALGSGAGDRPFAPAPRRRTPASGRARRGAGCALLPADADARPRRRARRC